MQPIPTKIPTLNPEEDMFSHYGTSIEPNTSCVEADVCSWSISQVLCLFLLFPIIFWQSNKATCWTVCFKSGIKMVTVPIILLQVAPMCANSCCLNGFLSVFWNKLSISEQYKQSCKLSSVLIFILILAYGEDLESTFRGYIYRKKRGKRGSVNKWWQCIIIERKLQKSWRTLKNAA